MIDVSYGSATDVGRVRQVNEDALLAEPPVFAVADGLGGHEAGEVASGIVAEELGRLGGREDVEADDLVAALEAAAGRVRELSTPTGAPLNAGTTATGLVGVHGDHGPEWLVFNVGDSRVYRLGEELEQVSVDHSLVQEMVDEGMLSPEQARYHPQRNVVTRALGGAERAEPDLRRVRAAPGTRWLVCSDGLTNELSDDELAAVLRSEPDPQAAADRLVREALEAGGHDNVAVVVVDERRGGTQHQ